MMRTAKFAIGLALGLFVPALFAAEPQTAREFLQDLYSNYADSNPDVLGDKADTVFAPSLLQLIRQDQNQPGGEVGKLDGDPICACQDFSITDVQVDVVSESERSAKANVRFLNLGQPREVRFQLARIAGRWRIDDLAEDDIASLRAFLAQPQD